MIKVLYIEDDSSHIELTSRSLENSGIQFDLQTASTIADAFNLLRKNEYDVVLSDYRLPDGSGLDVISIANEERLSTAIVLITNQEDINTAIAALKAGAVDYIIKQSDYLHRLPIVLSNAYKHTQVEKQKKALSEIENKYHNIFENAVEGIFQSSLEGRFISVNPAMADIYGYASSDDMLKSVVSIGTQIHTSNENRSKFIESLDVQGHVENYEAQNLRKDGSIIWASTNARAVKDEHGNTLYIEGFVKDITTQKQAEKLLERQLKALTVLHAAAMASALGNTEAGIIEQVTQIIASIYPDVCGVLLLNDQGNILTPHPSYIGANIINWKDGFPITEGISGEAVRTDTSIRINDITKDQDYVEISTETKSEICVPFRVQERIIGVLNVESKHLNAFDEEDERLLNTIAGGLGTAIEKLRLFEAEQTQRRRESAILELIRTAASSLDLNQVLQSILEQLVKVIPSDSGTIQLLEGDHLNSLAAIGKEAVEFVKYGPLLLGEFPLNNYVITEKQTVLVSNVLLDDRYRLLNQNTNIRSFLGIPLISKSNTIGMITLDSYQTSHFTKRDAELGLALANHASIAIENARLFDAEQQRRKQAEILREATGVLTSFFEQDKLFENIFITLAKLVSYDSVSIEIINEGYVEIVAGQNIPRELIGKKYLYESTKWYDAGNFRQPVIIADTQNEPRFEKFEQTNYIHGWMGIPLFSKDKIIGFLNFDSQTPNFFNEEHAAIAQTFANQVAIAIENSRLFELEQKRRKEAEIIRQAAAVLSNLLDLYSLHEAILEWLQKIIPFESASIFELEQGQIYLTAAKGLPDPKKVLGKIFSSENSLFKIIFERGEPFIVDDCKNDSRFEGWGGLENVRGWMGVPMITRGRVIGYITIDSHTPNAFTKNDALTAQTFAHQAANSLENSHLYTETLQRLEELEMVSRVSYALRAAQDTKEMIPILLNEIKTNLNTDTAAIWLYNLGVNELLPMAASGGLKNLPKSTFKPNEGIVGSVFSTGIMHVSPELTHDPIVNSENENFFNAGWAGITIPIRTVSETIGVLVVALPTRHEVSQNDIRLITTLTEIAGNAIYRSNLFEQSEEQIRRLTTLREMDTAITSSLDLHVTLGILTEHLLTKMDVSAATVLVFNPDSQTLDYYASSGFKSRENVRDSKNIGDGLAGQILLTRRAIYISDLSQDPNLAQSKSIKSEQFVSYYAVPLFSKGATKGILETYFRQPFAPNSDWLDFLHTLAEQAIIAIDNAQLFENLQQSNHELSLAYDTTLEGWGKALELRDKETQGHTYRVTNLTLELARQMNIPESELLQIRRGSLLHDIGKMGVPDNILHKTGPLTEDELVEMRKHPKYAYDLLYPIVYLRPALDIAYCHHEWWDGTGYPRGLKGEEIPLSARLFAIIDVWDALLSDRPYRPAWSHEKALIYIKGLSGKQFDPYVVSIFCKMIENDSQYLKSNPVKKILKTATKQPTKAKSIKKR